MADQWRASVKSIDGDPVFLVNLQVDASFVITRSNFRELEDQLKKAELEEVVDFAASVIFAEERPDSLFDISVSLRPTNRRGNLSAPAGLMSRFEENLFFDVAGDTKTGFSARLIKQGKERQIPLTTAKLVQLQADFEAVRQSAILKGLIVVAKWAEKALEKLGLIATAVDLFDRIRNAIDEFKARKERERVKDGFKDLTEGAERFDNEIAERIERIGRTA